MSAFSSQLRRLRKEKGLTQEQLAIQLHVTRQTISNWENDRAQPDYEMLSAIAAAFETPLSVLLGEEPAFAVQPLPSSGQTNQTNDAPPDLPASDKEQEPSEKATHLKPALYIAPAVLIVLFAVLFLVQEKSSAPSDSFSPERFTVAAEPLPGAAHLRIYTRENSSRYIQPRPESTPHWSVRFFMQETSGVALNIDMLTTVLFTKKGVYCIDALTPAQFKDTIGHPGIAPGEMRIYTFSITAEPDITGVGLEVQATDGKGNPLVFHFYQPLEYTPR